MSDPPPPPDAAQGILALARKDRDQARRALSACSIEDQVALVCEAPVARRGELLELLPAPERVIPALPEAELVFTVKAVGLADAGWILAHASDEQIQTCVDLDAWSEDLPDRARFDTWMAALAEGGDETLLRAAHAIDAELLALWLAERSEVAMKPGDDQNWQPPVGGATLDGVFYLTPRRSDDELQLAMQLLDLLFREDYWLYWRLLQAVTWESIPDNEEFALRWRSGRLQDLGFPPREEAIAIYAALRAEELDALGDDAADAETGEWHLPVWIPDLPAAADARHALFRAAAELDPAARRKLFYAFVALANQVAVADRLSLGDAESLPMAIEKSARLASLGLEWLAERHGVPITEVLRRTPLARLFRAGFHLDHAEPAP